MASINRWKSEIQSKEPDKPICLIMTKRDLLDEAEEEEIAQKFVTKKELLAKKKEFGLQKFATTSSKAWSDFNVHKAFNAIIMAGYEFKNPA